MAEVVIQSTESIWSNLLPEWTYSGVDHTLAGNGGVDCRDFIPYPQKVMESMMYTGLGLAEIYFTYPRCILPKTLPPTRTDGIGRRILLVIMCLTFGVEIGFKFATKQMIWILNPCHLVTMVQVSRVIASLFFPFVNDGSLPTCMCADVFISLHFVRFLYKLCWVFIYHMNVFSVVPVSTFKR